MARDTRTREIRPARSQQIRGGISWLAILTGVVVAFGALFLLLAVLGGILALTGVDTDEIVANATVEAGVTAAVVMVIMQLLAYLWGGYTAGRMGRGAGVVNGLLVPVGALFLAFVVWALARWMGETANLNLPFTATRIPVDNAYLVEWGSIVGVATLVAMFLGGILGGLMGARWHTKLERGVVEERTRAAEVDEARAARADEAAARERESERARIAAAERSRAMEAERTAETERSEPAPPGTGERLSGRRGSERPPQTSRTAAPSPETETPESRTAPREP